MILLGLVFAAPWWCGPSRLVEAAAAAAAAWSSFAISSSSHSSSRDLPPPARFGSFLRTTATKSQHKGGAPTQYSSTAWAPGRMMAAAAAAWILDDGADPDPAGEGATATSRRGEVVPPPLKLDDSAFDVLNLPCFRPNPLMNAQRREFLDRKSIRQVLEGAIRKADSPGRALNALSNEVGVSSRSLREYYAASDLSAKKVLAAAFLKAKYGGDFEEHVIEVGASLDPLRTPTAATGEKVKVIDTSFLDALRRDKHERFLISRTVYVRDGMRTIFGLMMEDIASNKVARRESTALVGSPGVGMSILLFLAALAQAQHRPVGYFRRTCADLESPSFFYMTPAEEGKVRVWFARNIDVLDLATNGGFTGLYVDLRQALHLRRDDYYVYIDGPDATEKKDLLGGTYDYYCTSENFPSYRSEEGRKRRWILDGWTRDEAIEGLVAMGFSDEKAEDAYHLCGGRIREMLVACDADDRPFVLTLLGQTLRGIDERSVELVLPNTACVGRNSFRLRTMFESRPSDSRKGDTWKRRMWACQRVDSPYLMEQLLSRLGPGPFLEAYNRAIFSERMDAKLVFFECLFHHRVRAMHADLKPTIQEVCWSKGTAVQVVKELDRSNRYWKPSTSQYKGVDAALVHNGALYVFCFTASAFQESFNGTALESDFVASVRAQVPVQHTVVLFVSPSGTHYRLEGHDAAGLPPSVTHRAVEVDTTNVESVDGSIRRIFDGLDAVAAPPAAGGSPPGSKRARRPPLNGPSRP